MIHNSLLFIQTLIQWDTIATIWINSFHTNYLDNFMEMCTGKFVWIPFYVSLVYALYKNFGWKQTVTYTILALVLLTINDQGTSSFIRPLVCRMRPSNLDNPISATIKVVDNYRGGRYGFPSAHAANCFGIAFFLSYIFKHRRFNVFLMCWALLMCYTRVYHGVHYVGDVFVGMLFGALTSSLMYGAMYVYRCRFIKLSSPITPPYILNSSLYIPIIVCLLTLTVMLIVAFFYDPDISL